VDIARYPSDVSGSEASSLRLVLPFTSKRDNHHDTDGVRRWLSSNPQSTNRIHHILALASLPFQVSATKEAGYLMESCRDVDNLHSKGDPNLAWGPMHGMWIPSSSIKRKSMIPVEDHGYGLSIKSAVIDVCTGKYSVSQYTAEQMQNMMSRTWPHTQPTSSNLNVSEGLEPSWDGTVWNPKWDCSLS
jgi:hypothetical protein